MFDHHDSIPLHYEPVEDLDELLHVGIVETDGRLVEEIDGPLGRLAVELGSDLHPLRLAARECRRRLSQLEVAESHLVQGLQPVRDRRDLVEECVRVLNRHGKHLMDVLPLIGDLECLLGEALAVTDVARHVDCREEMHLDRDEAVAFAGLAAATWAVERETPRLPAPDTCFFG